MTIVEFVSFDYFVIRKTQMKLYFIDFLLVFCCCFLFSQLKPPAPVRHSSPKDIKNTDEEGTRELKINK